MHEPFKETTDNWPRFSSWDEVAEEFRLKGDMLFNYLRKVVIFDKNWNINYDDLDKLNKITLFHFEVSSDGEWVTASAIVKNEEGKEEYFFFKDEPLHFETRFFIALQTFLKEKVGQSVDSKEV